MKKISSATAVKQRSKYPAKADDRIQDRMSFPSISPSFELKRGDQVFTIGSCFARNIEAKLKGFILPAASFDLPKGEVAQGLGNRILNEYNPGTIAQRMIAAAAGNYFGENGILDSPSGGSLDLLLAGGSKVPRERLLERRKEIDELYSRLPESDALIVTLGLVEAWYDRADGNYLNLFPGVPALLADPDRYELRILDADDVIELMRAAISAVVGTGLHRIILTVSPVPLQVSFSGFDCLIANMRSKSILVVAAHAIEQEFCEVDYFPSYDMVMSLGSEAFADDNVHVRPEVVAAVTSYMLENYVPPPTTPS